MGKTITKNIFNLSDVSGLIYLRIYELMMRKKKIEHLDRNAVANKSETKFNQLIYCTYCS